MCITICIYDETSIHYVDKIVENNDEKKVSFRQGTRLHKKECSLICQKILMHMWESQNRSGIDR